MHSWSHLFAYTWRKLRKRRFSFLVTLLTLSLGFSALTLIYFIGFSERSIDRFHDRQNFKFRVVRLSSRLPDAYKIGVTSASYAAALKDFYGNRIKSTVRVFPSRGLLESDSTRFFENRLFFSDSTFFTFFNLPLVEGEPDLVLRQPGSIVVTQSAARRWWPRASAIGKTIRWGTTEFIVTGIAADPPVDTHLKFDFVANLETLKSRFFYTNWWGNVLSTFVEVNQRADVEEIQKGFPEFLSRNLGFPASDASAMNLALQPLSDIYYDNEVRHDPIDQHGNRHTTGLLMLVTITLLLVVFINISNLNLAVYLRRQHETIVKFTLGAQKRSLAGEILAENLVIVVLATTLSSVFTYFAFPFLKARFQITAYMPGAFPNILFLLSLSGISTFLLSGYQVFRLFGMQRTFRLRPVNFSKNRFSGMRLLGEFQIMLTIFLIGCSLIMYRQIEFTLKSPSGISNGVLGVTLVNPIRLNQELVRDQLAASPSVVSATLASGMPGGFHDEYHFQVEGISRAIPFRTVFADGHYPITLGLTPVAGRLFEPGSAADSACSLLINETAATLLGLSPEKCIGLSIRESSENATPKRIIGVVSDFHFLALHKKIEPLVISAQSMPDMLLVRAVSSEKRAVEEQIRAIWKERAPGYPCEIRDISVTLTQTLKPYSNQLEVVGIFSLMVGLISLVGISAVTFRKYELLRRELSIRKVLGATNGDLFMKSVADELLLILPAIVLAVGGGYYAMDVWLRTFAVRLPAPVSAWMLAVSAAALVFTAISIFGFYRVSQANPAEVLREN